MGRIIGLILVLIIGHTAQAQTADEGRRSHPAYHADVEVMLNGIVRHGRLIMTEDGGIHLEHLDDEVRRGVVVLLRRASSSPSYGWDNRTDPVQCVWHRVGADDVLAEVHAPAASVIVTQHYLFPSRSPKPNPTESIIP